jgi:hypothetical protein
MLGRLIIVGLLFPSCLLAQGSRPLRGTVTSNSGQPIATVVVYTNAGTGCCEAITNDRGEFELMHSGKVLHFSNDKFEPLTMLMKSDLSQVHVALAPAANDLTIHDCRPPAPNEVQISVANSAVRFSVAQGARRRPTIRKGDPDPGGMVYLVKRNGGKVWMKIVFGPQSFLLDPEDRLFIDSRDFAQRNVARTNGAVIGRDSSGHNRKGRIWRATGVGGQAVAVYEDAKLQDAEFLDQVAFSMCEVPSTTKP